MRFQIRRQARRQGTCLGQGGVQRGDIDVRLAGGFDQPVQSVYENAVRCDRTRARRCCHDRRIKNHNRLYAPAAAWRQAARQQALFGDHHRGIGQRGQAFVGRAEIVVDVHGTREGDGIEPGGLGRGNALGVVLDDDRRIG